MNTEVKKLSINGIESLTLSIGELDLLDSGYFEGTTIFFEEYNEQNQQSLLQLESNQISSSIKFMYHEENQIQEYFVRTGSISINNSEIEIFFMLFVDENLKGTNYHPQALAKSMEKHQRKSDLKIENNFSKTDEVADMYITIISKMKLSKTIREKISNGYSKIEELLDIVKNDLKGYYWKEEYSVKEDMFCKEILKPLFTSMGFDSVCYNHGPNEFGKDFTFAKIDEFGIMKYYGVQVKAGNVSGKAKGDIDEIIGQIDDAFKSPFYDLNSKEPRFISLLLIIISGYYTNNAKLKIINKIPSSLKGAIYFFDKDKILSLIENHLRKNKSM